MNIQEELNALFCKVFDDNEIKITRETYSDDIDEWDSLSHINLVVAIEKHFKIKFNNAEILRWKNVGNMLDSINEKLNQK
ncbi:MAG TPA: acyl carrier protein [Bacteroidales bacterium]|nr:acyl carrier protein [Bacteroidales bacterium]HPS46817.1 acyl carrier protein [Bacteroidales bacterium]HQH17982.1 acyl carrier protein [Bacteroidales bacterium]HQI46605.1 acyl carrier protein [Bacteroidales bacterium]